jgi:PsbN protein
MIIMAVEKFVIESESTQLNVEENDPAIILVVFIISVLLGIVAYSIYVAFGPPASNLRDPFEEHED